MINYKNIDNTIYYKVFWLDWLNRYSYINWKIDIFEKLNFEWKKLYKLIIDWNIIFNWIWKWKAIKILNNWLKYCKKENFDWNIDWLIKSMVF